MRILFDTAIRHIMKCFFNLKSSRIFFSKKSFLKQQKSAVIIIIFIFGENFIITIMSRVSIFIRKLLKDFTIVFLGSFLKVSFYSTRVFCQWLPCIKNFNYNIHVFWIFFLAHTAVWVYLTEVFIKSNI